MFREQPEGRGDGANRLLAGYLAFTGGFVNSAGFILIGSFTSHVTGNVGRLANDIASGHLDAAGAAVVMITAFFVGAFLASMTIESNFFGHGAQAYGVALTMEATLLLVFTLVARLTVEAHPRLHDMEAAILCCAMGMQNSLVTRISGAVVRTTHLTGVFTDLGIEAARWFRWWRKEMSARVGVPLAFGRNPAERPSVVKLALLATIANFFMLGAIAGSAAAVWLRHGAMVLAGLAVAGCGAFAFWSARRDRALPLSGPDTRR
ncbi:MAG: YoaK family protein [Polyangiales bacterium]